MTTWWRTIEQMCLHVDMKAGKTCAAAPEVLASLMPIAKAQGALPRPADAGRVVAQDLRWRRVF